MILSILEYVEERFQWKYIAAYAPFGYKKVPVDKHHLIIDEVAAMVV